MNDDMLVAGMLSSRKASYSSKAFQKLFAEHVKMRVQEMNRKNESKLWYRFLQYLGLKPTRTINFHGMEVESIRAKMYDTFATMDLTLEALDEFEKWRSGQPKKRNKKPIDELKDFLKFKGEMPVSV